MNFRITLLGIFFLDLFSLLFIGKSWLVFFLPLFFILFVFYANSSWVSPFFLYLQHHILVFLFSSQSYLLYFIHLLSLLLLFAKHHSFFTKLPLWYYLAVVSALEVFFFLTEEFLYDMYILFGSLDLEYYMSLEVTILLTIIHIFLFFLLFFKGSVFFKKD